MPLDELRVSFFACGPSAACSVISLLLALLPISSSASPVLFAILVLLRSLFLVVHAGEVVQQRRFFGFRPYQNRLCGALLDCEVHQHRLRPRLDGVSSCRSHGDRQGLTEQSEMEMRRMKLFGVVGVCMIV